MKIHNVFRGKRRRALESRVDNLTQMVEAYRDYSQFQMTQESLRMRLTEISEIDPRLINLITNMSQYDVLVGHGLVGNDRLQTVKTSRYFQHWKLQAASATDTWTDWGFGREVSITPVDEHAREVWSVMWSAPKNKPVFKEEILHKHSETVLVDGEFFFVAYISKADGSVTWRTLYTESIKKVYHPEGDKAIDLYYQADRPDGDSVLIPDAFNYFALPDLFEKFKIPDGLSDINKAQDIIETESLVLILPVQRNIGRDGRGWPQFYRAFPWIDAYAQMLREYTQVFSAVAAFVDKIKADGGQRTVTDLVKRLQSSLTQGTGYQDRNPPPTAGATWVENQAVDRTRMPLGTAAGDAQAGTGIIASQMAQGLRVKASDVGRVDLFQNHAVAQIAAESPQQGWQRYQNFWTSIWKQVVEVTLRAAEEFSNAQFSTYDATVSMNLPIDVSTEDIKRAMDAITGAANSGFLDVDVAIQSNTILTRLMLLDLSASGVEDVFAATSESAAEAEGLNEAHAPLVVVHTCPLCGHGKALSYEGHGELLVCVKCGQTYDPLVEGSGDG